MHGFYNLQMRLMEQSEQHSLSQGLQTLQGVKLVTCLLLNITCSAVHCHKVGDWVIGNKLKSITNTLILELQMCYDAVRGYRECKGISTLPP